MRLPLSNWTPEQIRKLRLHCGMTQQQLAEELATRQATISEWECGKRTPQRFMKRALMRIAERAVFRLENTHVQTATGADTRARSV